MLEITGQIVGATEDMMIVLTLNKNHPHPAGVAASSKIYNTLKDKLASSGIHVASETGETKKSSRDLNVKIESWYTIPEIYLNEHDKNVKLNQQGPIFSTPLLCQVLLRALCRPNHPTLPDASESPFWAEWVTEKVLNILRY